jgi:hypothetical protein
MCKVGKNWEEGITGNSWSGGLVVWWSGKILQVRLITPYSRKKSTQGTKFGTLEPWNFEL